MRRILVALAAAAVLTAVHVGAEELATASNHLVTPDVAQARLTEANAERARDLATVDSFLLSPNGAAAMKVVGVSQDRVRGALPTLSDAELQDVAARAAALQSDPVAAGLTTKQWIWVAIGVAVVATIIIHAA